jgi:hypothetical protein
MQNLLPESDFRLFAVAVRFPTGLAQQVTLTRLKEGVYDMNLITGTLRVVVVHQLPEEEHNAMLHLFSARAESLRYGAEHYRQRSEETSTLLLNLFKKYRLEGMTMPDALEQLARETIDEILGSLSVEERLQGISPEERLKGISSEERLKGISTDDLLAGLTPEALASLLRRLRDKDGTNIPD